VPASAILADFPLAVGTTWAYSVEVTFLESFTDSGTARYGYWNGTVVHTITEEVSVDGLRAFTVTVEAKPAPPDGTWIESGEFQYLLAPDGVMEHGTKIYQWPLADGTSWRAWPDFDYEWQVAASDAVYTPFRTFRGCYRFALITGPDSTIKTFCPGVGFVQWDYWHHPPSPYQRWSLLSFHAGA
jgi:hypothetical protein